jgi:hypothetical protein
MSLESGCYLQRRRIENSPTDDRQNSAWLRRFTLSLLKQHPGKDSLAMKRRICGWNDDFLMQVPGRKPI